MNALSQLRHWVHCAVLGAGVVLGESPVLAKRGPPPDVPPLVYQGVRYEAPPGAMENPCGQEGGCVVAYDDASGASLWSVEVYCSHYDPNLELDVQWVYVTSLSIKDGQIAVTNEKNQHFSIDPLTHAVTGDARGCPDSGGTPQGGGSSGGCRVALPSPSSSGAAPTWMVLGLSAAWLRRRGRSVRDSSTRRAGGREADAVRVASTMVSEH